MKLFKAEDVPLVADGIYALVCLIANRVMTEDEKNELYDVMHERFIKQGFDETRSEKVAKMLSDAINQKQGIDTVNARTIYRTPTNIAGNDG